MSSTSPAQVSFRIVVSPDPMVLPPELGFPVKRSVRFLIAYRLSAVRFALALSDRAPNQLSELTTSNVSALAMQYVLASGATFFCNEFSSVVLLGRLAGSSVFFSAVAGEAVREAVSVLVAVRSGILQSGDRQAEVFVIEELFPRLRRPIVVVVFRCWLERPPKGFRHKNSRDPGRQCP
jgi:hypothetical protein